MTGSFFDKMKDMTRQAASETNKAARTAKLKMNVISLNSEKGRHLQTIGQRVFTLYSENQSINGSVLQEKITEELNQVERIEAKIKELEADIASQGVNVTDVTEQ